MTDFAVRIRGGTTREQDAKVELDEHLVVVKLEGGREDGAYRGSNKHLRARLVLCEGWIRIRENVHWQDVGVIAKIGGRGLRRSGEGRVERRFIVVLLAWFQV